MSEESPPDDTCPFCRTYIADTARVERALKEFDNEVEKRIRGFSREKEKEFRAVIRELKDSQRKELQKMRALGMSKETQTKKKLASASKREKAANKAALARVKKNHQDQLWSMKELYEKENLKLQKESESGFSAQLKEIIKNYGNLASGYQKDTERVKKSQEQLDLDLREKESELTRLKIELAQSKSALEVKGLQIELNDRNSTIERLSARVRELENKIGLGQSVAATPPTNSNKTMNDEEQREKLKEYMRAIIEITRSQQGDKKLPFKSKGGEKPEQEEGESKVDKLLGWFF